MHSQPTMTSRPSPRPPSPLISGPGYEARAHVWPVGPAPGSQGGTGGIRAHGARGLSVSQETAAWVREGASRVASVSPRGSSRAAGMKVMARSASAAMVSEGLTPGLAEMAEPSTTYSPS